MIKPRTFEEYRDYYNAMAQGHNKAAAVDPGDDEITAVKKIYIQLHNIGKVAEWAMQNIPGFEENKTRAYNKVADLIDNRPCRDRDIDLVCEVTRSYGLTYADRRWG